MPFPFSSLFSVCQWVGCVSKSDLWISCCSLSHSETSCVHHPSWRLGFGSVNLPLITIISTVNPAPSPTVSKLFSVQSCVHFQVLAASSHVLWGVRRWIHSTLSSCKMDAPGPKQWFHIREENVQIQSFPWIWRLPWFSTQECFPAALFLILQLLRFPDYSLLVLEEFCWLHLYSFHLGLKKPN